ncbi:MAG: YihA family ribosome biogenesis GTP-binding protein, partial [Tenericutes bacterium]|nr:YihA family ribosome biogenesis GTP-binding protein [Mycoplasmatota bacterium]
RIPNEDDFIMYEYFKSLGKQILIVLTKSDKLSNNKKYNQIRKIKKVLNARKEDIILPFSKETLENKLEIIQIFEDNVLRHNNG